MGRTFFLYASYSSGVKSFPPSSSPTILQQNTVDIVFHITSWACLWRRSGAVVDASNYRSKVSGSRPDLGCCIDFLQTRHCHHENQLYLNCEVEVPGGERGGGGFSPIWPIRVCATGQGMVFGLFVLNKAYNLMSCRINGKLLDWLSVVCRPYSLRITNQVYWQLYCIP